MQITALLDFDNATMAPPFTDARDLTLSVFLKDPDSGTAFWEEYGPLDEPRRRLLELHCLQRLLSVLAAYEGPAPGGWNAGTVDTVLRRLEA
jgi:aminoglycoside phosphotransferase (APT) family kinase protein